jgi:hypothetical protein
MQLMADKLALCSLFSSGLAIFLFPSPIQNHMPAPFLHFLKTDEINCNSNFCGALCNIVLEAVCYKPEGSQI